MNLTIRTGPLICRRCDGEPYLSVQVPRMDWPDRNGNHTAYRVVTLCPRCDVDDTNSHALLAFFAFHGSILNVEVGTEFLELVESWVGGLQPPRTVSPEDFEADVAAYYNGEFDDA